jgi:lantibiotic modifying enzyme
MRCQVFVDGQTGHPRTEILARAAAIEENISTSGWLCGTPQAVDTPGLMTGIAGIGYGLLRAAQPDRVPCVLVLG